MIEHLEMLNECIIVVSCIMCKLMFIYSLFYGRDKKIKSFFFIILLIVTNDKEKENRPRAPSSQ